MDIFKFNRTAPAVPPRLFIFEFTYFDILILRDSTIFRMSPDNTHCLKDRAADSLSDPLGDSSSRSSRDHYSLENHSSTCFDSCPIESDQFSKLMDRQYFSWRSIGIGISILLCLGLGLLVVMQSMVSHKYHLFLFCSYFRPFFTPLLTLLLEDFLVLDTLVL